MNREQLDEFFARADDVLTDWHGGTDAMHAKPPTADDLVDLPQAVDSYYEQLPARIASWSASIFLTRSYDPITDGMRQFGAALSAAAGEANLVFAKFARQMQEAGLMPDTPPADDARARALWLRQNRSTGPADRRGLDGRIRA